MCDSEENCQCRRSLLEAITYKYIIAMKEDPSNSSIYVPKRGLVTLSESGDLILPENVDLTDYKIDSAGNVDELVRLACNVKELILHGNCLQVWDEVLTIVSGMPMLTFLNLTANSLSEMVVRPSEKSVFPNISHLVLNKTRVPWDTLEALLQCFFSLVELHLSLNDYTDVCLSDQLEYPSLKILFFNGNAVTSWPKICKLGRAFPNLEDLMMCGCKFTNIGSDGHEAFSRLRRWSLSQTHLEGWGDVDQLRHFPALYDVRLQDIAFLQKYKQKERRQLIIARTPNIICLNGSRIEALDREDAERAFIRKYMDADEKPERYFELEKVHGKLHPLANVCMTPQTTFKVSVVFDEQVQVMEISTSQTVGQLKSSLASLFGQPPNKCRLFYLDKQISHGLEELKFPQKMVYNLNVDDGDEFHIWLKCR
ncbi:tubulin-specific chaperone cofactor E-like protein [Gigantopelta aegis]|uniref:tubulin-specific chaperone cofactor E-like protein n=1 Tax=Gigantopelta aegis TaxID=1735272 RepID=UPI001B889B66|nr:tubulin-specific chaperone cofactor E-like protein [Gigantopelta aegis]